ncbi:MAG: hypothetical protein WCH46_03585 [bacterium]
MARRAGARENFLKGKIMDSDKVKKKKEELEYSLYRLADTLKGTNPANPRGIINSMSMPLMCELIDLRAKEIAINVTKKLIEDPERIYI